MDIGNEWIWSLKNVRVIEYRFLLMMLAPNMLYALCTTYLDKSKT